MRILRDNRRQRSGFHRKPRARERTALVLLLLYVLSGEAWKHLKRYRHPLRRLERATARAARAAQAEGRRWAR